jgi:hypothetical protein
MEAMSLTRVTVLSGGHPECAEAGKTDPVQRFIDEMAWDFKNERSREVDFHRFLVSRFFVRTRKLAHAGYLPEKLVREALGGAAIEDVFLKLVDPLDKTASPNYGAEDNKFYSELLQKHPRVRRSK